MRSTTDLNVANLLERNRFVVDTAGIAFAVDDQLQGSPRFPKNVPARSVDHHSIETCLNGRHLCRDLLPKRVVVSQALRFDATNDRLGLFNKLVKLFIASDVELAKP